MAASGQKQVFRIIRHRHTLRTGADSSEVAYGITSLSPESAGGAGSRGRRMAQEAARHASASFESCSLQGDVLFPPCTDGSLHH